MMDNLPDGWLEAKLGELFILNPRIKVDDCMEVGFMPMAGVPVNLFGENKFELKKWNEVKKGYTCFTDGDIIFAKITPCFENSKASIIRNFPNKVGTGSTEFFVLHPWLSQEVNLFFFYCLVKSEHFLKNGALNMTGSVGHKRVPKEFVENYNFYLPPLAEQQYIATLLDQHLAQVEQIKTRLAAIPALLKKFRQSVLADAVSGKLTEEWRGGRGIQDWKNLTIGDIATVKTGKTPSRKEGKYWENGKIAWLTSSATGQNFCFQAHEFISEIASNDCNLKPFPKGSLLLAMYGEGKTRGQVTELMIEATCNQACAVIITNRDFALTAFVKLRLKENYETIRKAASGGNQPNLNLNKVREITINAPPLEEQTEIVCRVEQLFAHADHIEKSVLEAQKRVNNLTQSILAKAFSGELTAAWRAQNLDLISGDNSAAKLLERIQLEREATSNKAKKTKGVKA